MINCKECKYKCCEEIAVQISTPKSADDFKDIKWYLYHPGISIEIDKDDIWWVKFNSRCGKLDKTGNCKIYPERPPVCRNLSLKECDANNPPKHEFRSVKAYEQWLRKVFKKT